MTVAVERGLSNSSFSMEILMAQVLAVSQWNILPGSTDVQAVGEAEAQVPGSLLWPPHDPCVGLILKLAVWGDWLKLPLIQYASDNSCSQCWVFRPNLIYNFDKISYARGAKKYSLMGRVHSFQLFHVAPFHLPSPSCPKYYKIGCSGLVTESKQP
jgi:hypothetical protein